MSGVQILNSSEDLKSAVGKDQLSVIWIFDSDGANKGFGRKYEEWVATEIKDAVFYKAGTDDVKDASKEFRLSPDSIAFFKNGKLIDEEREDHNAVHKKAKSLI